MLDWQATRAVALCDLGVSHLSQECLVYAAWNEANLTLVINLMELLDLFS
jgi:hypothetical protein